MSHSLQLKNTNKTLGVLIFIAFALGSSALSSTSRAVTPPPDGGYANENTAEGEDALFSVTTGGANTAMVSTRFLTSP